MYRFLLLFYPFSNCLWVGEWWRKLAGAQSSKRLFLFYVTWYILLLPHNFQQVFLKISIQYGGNVYKSPSKQNKGFAINIETEIYLFGDQITLNENNLVSRSLRRPEIWVRDFAKNLIYMSYSWTVLPTNLHYKNPTRQRSELITLPTKIYEKKGNGSSCAIDFISRSRNVFQLLKLKRAFKQISFARITKMLNHTFKWV